MGYVGLPLAVAFAEAGESVVAIDIDEGKVAAIIAGESYVEDISSERLRAAAPSIEASTHFAPLARTEAVLICAPTPLTTNREPDLGPLLAATEALAVVVQRGQLVVLESTTYPGTGCREQRNEKCRLNGRSAPSAGLRRACSGVEGLAHSRVSLVHRRRDRLTCRGAGARGGSRRARAA